MPNIAECEIIPGYHEDTLDLCIASQRTVAFFHLTVLPLPGGQRCRYTEPSRVFNPSFDEVAGLLDEG